MCSVEIYQKILWCFPFYSYTLISLIHLTLTFLKLMAHFTAKVFQKTWFCTKAKQKIVVSFKSFFCFINQTILNIKAKNCYKTLVILIKNNDPIESVKLRITVLYKIDCCWALGKQRYPVSNMFNLKREICLVLKASNH